MKPLLVADVAETRVATGAIGLDLAVDRAATSTSPASEQVEVRRDISDNAARLILVGLFTFMAVRLGANYLETGRLTGLLLLASEALVVVFTVLRRAPAVVDRSLRARLLTILAMMGPPLVRPAALTPLVPDAATVAVSVVGLLIVIGGKLSLGRSFGLIPANRGIVSTGLYRFVRHPIYLGYLLTHFAFVAANPTTWNISLLAAADFALLARAVCEEKTLTLDDDYRAYRARVRWRVLPGLF